ncbi:MAG: hypothetical protein IAE82_13590 [Opitutaceae bacterium]|nr:hypothetical protein [Opitutaceae bacterium]
MAVAVAVGVCLFYAFQFVVLTPFAVVGTIYLGIGLLPLSPLIGVLLGLGVFSQLSRQARRDGAAKARRAWPWIFAGAGALVLADLSPTCASLGMRWYASHDPATQARGLTLLRSVWVDTEDIEQSWRAAGPMTGTNVVLNLLTGQSGRIFGLDFERARFAATGAARDLADPDLWRRSRGRGRAGDGRWSVLGNLALDGSRLDGTIDPDLLYGYVEWTMTLRNSESWPLEGRATLQLPPGGVVSRVTLWIAGEEREAAFAGRAAATQAYESVAIVQRRDPILVTTAGPDRARLRCFPVPASGEMKFRLGITFPLRPTPDGAAAEVCLPSVIESNFMIPGALQHSLWVSRAGTDGVRVEDADTRSLRGPVGRDALRALFVRVSRDASVGRVVARGVDDTAVIVQQLGRAKVPGRRLMIVVDGNPRVLRGCGTALAQCVAGVGPVDTALWCALDRPVHRDFPGPEAARAWLTEGVDAGEMSDANGGTVAIPRRGGFDNGPALVAALTECAGSEGGGVVIWVHGPQVGSAGSAEAVRQVLERTQGRARLVTVCAVPGRNDLLDALDGRPEVRGAGALEAGALRQAILRQAGDAAVDVTRHVEMASSVATGATVAPTRHLARLWAAEEAARLMARGPARQAEAVALAVKHQVVTPVSGAVVLETQQQYDAHGLSPVDPASVPSVPERASILVVFLAGGAITAAAVIRRRVCRRATS